MYLNPSVKKKPEAIPRSAGPAPGVLASGFASKGTGGPRAPQPPADREPRAASLQWASLGKRKEKQQQKQNWEVPWKRRITFLIRTPDQSSSALFLSKQVAGKKKNQTKSNTSALNVNSTPALRKLLGYVLKVGYALLWASLPHCLLFQRRNLALKKERKEETKKRKKNPWLSEVHASIYRSVWVCTRFPSQQKSSEQRCHNIYQCSKKYHFWKKNIPLVLPFLD